VRVYERVCVGNCVHECVCLCADVCVCVLECVGVCVCVHVNAFVHVTKLEVMLTHLRMVNPQPYLLS